MTDLEVKLLVEWVGENSFAEVDIASVLFKQANSVVSVYGLLDKISELTGIDKDQLGEWAGDLNGRTAP